MKKLGRLNWSAREKTLPLHELQIARERLWDRTWVSKMRKPANTSCVLCMARVQRSVINLLVACITTRWMPYHPCDDRHPAKRNVINTFATQKGPITGPPLLVKLVALTVESREWWYNGGWGEAQPENMGSRLHEYTSDRIIPPTFSSKHITRFQTFVIRNLI